MKYVRLYDENKNGVIVDEKEVMGGVDLFETNLTIENDGIEESVCGTFGDILVLGREAQIEHNVVRDYYGREESTTIESFVLGWDSLSCVQDGSGNWSGWERSADLKFVKSIEYRHESYNYGRAIEYFIFREGNSYTIGRTNEGYVTNMEVVEIDISLEEAEAIIEDMRPDCLL